MSHTRYFAERLDGLCFVKHPMMAREDQCTPLDIIIHAANQHVLQVGLSLPLHPYPDAITRRQAILSDPDEAFARIRRSKA